MAAKKKSKKKVQQSAKMSPERYMREKVRNLPIGKCYVNADWKQSGMAWIIITRLRPNNHFVVGHFLVDTFCLGVKKAGCNPDLDAYDYKDYIDYYKEKNQWEETSYNEVHNIIYGAISFAEEGGIRPCKDFQLARFLLEEDTEDIPLIEYEYGKDGKHFLFLKEKQDKAYLHTLEKTLGDDFKCAVSKDSVDEFDDDWGDDWDDEEDDNSEEFLLDKLEQLQKSIVREPYTYQYPAYPQTLSVKNQFIADAFYSKEHFNYLPKPLIQRILDLPADEAAQDISHIVFYEIGRSYDAINKDTFDDENQTALLHSVFLLVLLQSDKGLDAILEIMRQNQQFIETQLGTKPMLHAALYACGLNHVQAILDYLHEPGLYAYTRYLAIRALAMIVYHHPERRNEIIQALRELLTSWIDNLSRLYACDGALVGLTMATLIDMRAVELIPEVRRLYETGCVPIIICGDCEAVIRFISESKEWKSEHWYELPDIYQEYEYLKTFFPAQ